MSLQQRATKPGIVKIFQIRNIAYTCISPSKKNTFHWTAEEIAYLSVFHECQCRPDWLFFLVVRLLAEIDRSTAKNAVQRWYNALNICIYSSWKSVIRLSDYCSSRLFAWANVLMSKYDIFLWLIETDFSALQRLMLEFVRQLKYLRQVAHAGRVINTEIG